MKLKNVTTFALSISALALFAGCQQEEQKTTTVETQDSETVDLNSLDLPQLDNDIKENEDVVEIETTEGNIKVKLFPEIAPKAVENFMTHAKDGYYNDTPFHRVMEGFMIQGGDPDGTGMGGESIWGEGFTVEDSNQLYHVRGALAMARANSRDSQGSQFYIVQNDEDVSAGQAVQFTPEKIIEAYKQGGTPKLDGEYTVFGQVIEGMDVVDKIAKAPKKAAAGGENSTPENPVKVTNMKIIQEAK